MGKSVLVVSPTHDECKHVTDAIREALQHQNIIGADQHNLLKLTSRNLTLAQKRDSVNYVDGDTIIFNQNAKGYRKGQRLVVGVDSIPLALADRFEVYHTGELAVAKGDLIRVTANGTTLDGHRFSNGQTYYVKDIAGNGTLTLNNGWQLNPLFGQIDYGYCSTSHSAQGKTRDKVIVAMSSESFPAASKEQFYVSVSRGKSQCSIYTDDQMGLVDAISESNDSLSATELERRNRMQNILRHSNFEIPQPHMIPEQSRTGVQHGR